MSFIVKGEQVKAFHPHMLGVIKTGTVVSVGRKYAQVDFGPLLGGIVRVPLRDVVEAA